MDARMEKQVRERAYQIWIEAGRQQGLEHEHWIAAERDVAATVTAKPSKRATASKAKPVVAKVAVVTRQTALKTVGKEIAGKETAAKKTAKAPEAKLVAVKARAAKSAKSAMSDAHSSLN